MNRVLWWAVVVLAVLVAASYLWFFSARRQSPAPSPSQQVTRSVPEPPPEAPLHPLPEVVQEPGEKTRPLALDQPLPALAEADGRMRQMLAGLFPDRQLERFFILENVIERFVVMVDNLPRSQLPRRYLPFKAVPGNFRATGEEGQLVIDPANYRRYDPYVRLAEAVDVSLATAVYTRFYPLFQQAYEGLGYEHGYFNDRLIEVIDHLLETPKITDPVRLVQPQVPYRFADPELERLSAGQKILLRTGPVNAERLKGVLREFRRELQADARG